MIPPDVESWEPDRDKLIVHEVKYVDHAGTSE